MVFTQTALLKYVYFQPCVLVSVTANMLIARSTTSDIPSSQSYSKDRKRCITLNNILKKTLKKKSHKHNYLIYVSFHKEIDTTESLEHVLSLNRSLKPFGVE